MTKFENNNQREQQDNILNKQNQLNFMCHIQSDITLSLPIYIMNSFHSVRFFLGTYTLYRIGIKSNPKLIYLIYIIRTVLPVLICFSITFILSHIGFK